MLPSAFPTASASRLRIFEAQLPSPSVPLFTLRRTPHDAPRKTRGRVVRYSFLVRLFHSLLHAGLSRRTGTCLFSTVRLWWFKRCRRLNWLGQGSTDGIWLILTIHKKIHSTGRESIPRPCSFDHPAGLPIFANPELLRECRRALQPHQTHRPLLEIRFEW